MSPWPTRPAPEPRATAWQHGSLGVVALPSWSVPMWGVPWPVLLLYAADVGLGLAYVLNVVAGSPFRNLSAFVDLGREANLPTWYASTQLFIIAALFGVAAYCGSGTRWRGCLRGWMLAALFLLFSLDETARIHEELGEQSDGLLAGGTREGSLFPETGIWMLLIGVPVAVLVLLLVGSLRRDLAHVPGAFARLIGGSVLLFGSALIPELLSNFTAAESTARVIAVVVEEVGELLGATTILWAVHTVVLARWAGAQERPSLREHP